MCIRDRCRLTLAKAICLHIIAEIGAPLGVGSVLPVITPISLTSLAPVSYTHLHSSLFKQVLQIHNWVIACHPQTNECRSPDSTNTTGISACCIHKRVYFRQVIWSNSFSPNQSLPILLAFTIKRSSFFPANRTEFTNSTLFHEFTP